eukprot:scaffold71802_cov20-Tisochrysis_lutea.AAC.1
MSVECADLRSGNAGDEPGAVCLAFVHSEVSESQQAAKGLSCLSAWYEAVASMFNKCRWLMIKVIEVRSGKRLNSTYGQVAHGEQHMWLSRSTSTAALIRFVRHVDFRATTMCLSGPWLSTCATPRSRQRRRHRKSSTSKPSLTASGRCRGDGAHRVQALSIMHLFRNMVLVLCWRLCPLWRGTLQCCAFH